MASYDFEVRIAYADTDRMGVVYYANYLVLFERGRTEYLRSVGLRYRDLEDDAHLFMPVVEAHCEYFAPARYDDLIRVRTFLGKVGSASIEFRHEIFRAESGEKIAAGYTRHAVVGKTWKVIRMPEFLRQKLEK